MSGQDCASSKRVTALLVVVLGHAGIGHSMCRVQSEDAPPSAILLLLSSHGCGVHHARCRCEPLLVERSSEVVKGLGAKWTVVLTGDDGIDNPMGIYVQHKEDTARENFHGSRESPLSAPIASGA